VTMAQAIRSTRGTLRDVASVAAWAAGAPEAAAALRGRRLVYFNGAFSPPTRAHAHIAEALVKDPGLDALWLDPEPARPGKERWQDETLEARIAMCELLAEEVAPGGSVGVGTLRRDLGPEVGTSTELFRVLRALLGGPGQGKLVWALGADVFEGMRHWADKARACLQPGDTCDGIVVFMRAGRTEETLWAAAKSIGHAPCEVQVMPMPQDLAGVSSHLARQALAQAMPRAGAEAAEVMLPSVAEFCLARPGLCKLYQEQVAQTPAPEAGGCRGARGGAGRTRSRL